MSSRHTDQNLLFGFLALQNDFISREDLIAAVTLWLTDKNRPLDDILRERKALAEDEWQLVAALVRKHLERHGDDAERSLAALSSVGRLREDLKRLGDADVEATLAHVSTSRPNPASDPLATLPVSDAPSESTRFRILRPHAEGGLGQVFVAKDEELNREVALKEIKLLRADDPDSRSRFLLEAEITGGLEHPGIVPVYGLGQYADGRPFYAMRFIRGDSLAEAADRVHAQGTVAGQINYDSVEFRKLLGRFIDVCNAIEYAHSRGVLHRDLKPGNIMLGKYGETLVVDWGLAKAKGRDEQHQHSEEQTLQPRSGSGTSVTLVGAAIGTPAYMSPEQAAGRLDELGPPADVYSLGATLYYLLTGQPPFGREDIGTLLRKIQAGDFLPPRARKQTIPLALEAICLKAMQRAPADRYASPQLLAEDVERYLADEKIAAHAEPISARARRWLRKHPRSVATLFATMSMSFVTVVAVLFVVLIYRTHEDRLRRRSETVWRYLASDLMQPGEDGRSLKLVDVLDRMAKEPAKEIASDPEAKAHYLFMVGSAYLNLGLPDRAIPVIQDVYDALAQKLGKNHRDTLLAGGNLAMAYLRAKRYDEAISLYEQIVDSETRILGSAHSSTIGAATGLGQAYAGARQFDKAISVLETTLEQSRTRLGPHHGHTLGCVDVLAETHRESGHPEKAIALYQQTLDSLERKSGDEHNLHLFIEKLMTSHYSAGEMDKARSYVKRLVDAERTKLNGDKVQVASMLARRCLDVLKHKDFSTAEALLRECLAIREEKMADNWLTFNTKSMLGSALAGQQKFEEAELLLRQGHEGMKERKAKIPAAGKVRYRESIERLVDLYSALNKPDEAERWRGELATFDAVRTTEKATSNQEKPLD